MDTFSHIFERLEKIASCYARVEAADNMVKEARGQFMKLLTGTARAGGKAVRGSRIINKLHTGAGGNSLLNQVRFNRMGLPELRGKVLNEGDLRRLLASEFKQFRSSKLEDFAPGEILQHFKMLRRAANKGRLKRGVESLGFKPHGKPVKVKTAPAKTNAQPASATEPVVAPTKPATPPAAEPVAPTKPAGEPVAPTKPATQPASATEPVAPTKPATQPAGEPVAPKSEPTVTPESNTGTTTAPKSNTGNTTAPKSNTSGAANATDDAAGATANATDDAAVGLFKGRDWWKWGGGMAAGAGLYAMASPHPAPQNYTADSNSQYVDSM